MERILGRYEPYLYAVLRIVAGLLFLEHGTQKLFGFPTGPRMPLEPLMGVAGAIEMVAGILITLGLFAGTAAFIASGEMAVAYFHVHFAGSFWPIQNKGELAVLFCFLWLYVAARGSGIWSLDSLIFRSRTHPIEPAPAARAV